ncbi:MAG: hypothetical protein KatS3mg110_4098 [Pirellulaceae bacterium]|nr:MAG: hypothetical protein KatS3mg110_4098 [Pirellulaceae bacterium]
MKALVEYFGADRYVDQITAADAEDYRLWLTRRGLASATVHKHIRIARQLWGDAMLRRLATTNPFAAVKASATPNPERKRFITREETARLLEACNPTWRVIVALCRYGGLRCPSEVLSLRWEDVLWDRGRIVVHSPKTEHHAGKATRIVPLFPELREILAEAFAQAADGSVYVVEAPRYRTRGVQSWKACNMRTQFLRIVKRAGLQPWPRLFHNLRASRATELAAEYPQHVLTAWLGHSPDVAERHYLQVREEDFQRAAYGVQKGGAKSGALEAQNAAQQPFADFRNEQQPIGASADESTHYVASRCKDRQAAEDREWAHEDSNFGPRRYQRRALTN